jgi:hypothetical protein
MQGTLSPAERYYEGIETDWYRCPLGHESGVDWSHSAPLRSPVPEPAELVKHVALAALGTVRAPDLCAALRSQLPAGLAAHVEVDVYPFPEAKGTEAVELRIWVSGALPADLRSQLETLCAAALPAPAL